MIPVLMVLVGSYAEEHTSRQWRALSRMGASFLDAMQGLTTSKVFGRSADEGEKVAAASEEFRRRTMKVLRYAFLSGFVLEFMTAAAIGLVAVTLGVRVISGNMPFEVAFLVLAPHARVLQTAARARCPPPRRDGRERRRGPYLRDPLHPGTCATGFGGPGSRLRTKYPSSSPVSVTRIQGAKGRRSGSLARTSGRNQDRARRAQRVGQEHAGVPA